MEQINKIRRDLVIKKNYIKTVEDFAKFIEDEYKINPWSNYLEVTSLVIIKNYLSTIEFTKIIRNFSSLSLQYITKINLTANDLKEIPQEMQLLTNLNTLILNNNKIERIDNLSGLLHLVHLELRTNRIKKFENLKSLTNLSRLSLSCNCIETIDEVEVGEWNHLEEFGVFANFLGDPLDNENNRKVLVDLLRVFRIKMSNLKNLSIGGNHFSKSDDFTTVVSTYLVNLKKIDGIAVIPTPIKDN